MNESTVDQRNKQITGRGLSIACAAGLLALTMTPSAFAQTEQDEATDNSTLEEVIVTATRREESLMEVPIAVTAFSGEELEQFGIPDITYIAQMSPNTTLEVSRGTNTTLTAFIRGVGQQDPVAGFESGVGLYLDDVYLNRPQATVMDIYDVERVEVLRGPQGTLYGRNTIGGAIKYVTKRLNPDSAEGSARLSYGSYNMLDLVLTASVPLGDTFRIGGSIASFNRDGFGDNLNLKGVENYNKDVLGFRFSAEWEPNEDWFLRFAADYVEDDSDPRQGHRLYDAAFSGNPVLKNVYDTEAGLNNPTQSVEAQGWSLLAEWNASDLITFKNILAGREDESWTPIDFDSLPAVDLDVPAIYENEQFSEELQMLFSADNWSGLLGFYYLDANAHTAFDVILDQLGQIAFGLAGYNAYTEGDVDTKTWSLFGDFTYNITEEWSISLGGRYTEDKRTSMVLRQNKLGGTSPIFGGSAFPIATTSDFQGSETFSDFTPRLAVDWTPNDDHLIYGSYSEGFKGGSFDPRGLTTAAPDTDGDGVVSEEEVFEYMKFDPETVETFEFGWKATLAQGRMTSKLSVFFSDYTDVQVPGSIGVDTTGDGREDTFIGITTNAGAAEINGIEWEGQAILADDLGQAGSSLRFAWSLGYIDAEYKEFIGATGEDVADERVFQNTPDWTAGGILTYDVPVNLFNTPGVFSVITSLSYRGKTSQFEIPTPELDQDSYTLWDLSLVWRQDSGRWSAGIHGKNLTDEEYKVAGYYFPSLGLENNVTAFYGNPRQIWGTVQFNWF
ncbi:MAG: TonB-dependent receptor [Xanthomonadales bacterium]|nr:TonB-dependent receptor [Gammaproteobacteria bacterium]MBT8073129.1 TonB-dependent receptor [Gammaproteobacteria bacterium]MBT8076005.1 TonB-dependent receptor [Gammaproteobacteria bacterium]NNK03973.1 TonB-dependent receptor [Xanthomonadales bacterium]NNL00409.1 TonB-dependent receptor [Xanthomonadales bacterium]